MPSQSELVTLVGLEGRGRAEVWADMLRRMDADASRLDEAARAGWLYYVAGNTQDEIARKLGISRQAAQRLVSLAISERLIKVRLDHPIGRCLELAADLRDRFCLQFCEVAPTDPASHSSTLGVAEVAAAEMERWLRSVEPIVVGIGTGRTMRAVADLLPRMECPQHKLVALVGTTKPDGSATNYDVIMRISDIVRAPHYPMPTPVVARSIEEKRILFSLESVRNVIDLAGRADVTFVGVGPLGLDSPLVRDGAITRGQAEAICRRGAVGEIIGRPFDRDGRLLDGGYCDSVSSAPLKTPATAPFIGVAMGPAREAAIHAAMVGKILSGVITDEATAQRLLGR